MILMKNLDVNEKLYITDKTLNTVAKKLYIVTEDSYYTFLHLNRQF